MAMNTVTNQNEHAHLSTQLCGTILNQSTNHRRKMRVNSANDTKTKTTKRMPFKFYISVISHYYSNATYGEFISSQCQIQGSLGVDSALRRLAECWRRYSNAYEWFRKKGLKTLLIFFVTPCKLICVALVVPLVAISKVLPPTIARNLKFPEVRHETERHCLKNIWVKLPQIAWGFISLPKC